MNPFDPEAMNEKLQASQVSSSPPGLEALGAANCRCAAASLILWMGGAGELQRELAEHKCGQPAKWRGGSLC